MESGLKTRLDYGDYCTIPTDGKRYELLEGDIHVTPAPSPSHQRVILRLARLLQDYFVSSAEVFVSPVDVILSPHDVIQPDIVVVAEPAQVTQRGIEGAPLLVIEVLSPATVAYDRTVKSQRYATLGVDHYWIVDPANRQVECRRREGQIYRIALSAGMERMLAHPDFPGLDLPVSELFR
jgi:Uma2 family endonuclease